MSQSNQMQAGYAGAVLATVIVTQIFKGVAFIEKIPTRIFSYFVALAVLLAATFFGGNWSLANAALCLLNAVVVSLAANGGYDGAVALASGLKQ